MRERRRTDVLAALGRIALQQAIQYRSNFLFSFLVGGVTSLAVVFPLFFVCACVLFRCVVLLCAYVFMCTPHHHALALSPALGCRGRDGRPQVGGTAAPLQAHRVRLRPFSVGRWRSVCFGFVG